MRRKKNVFQRYPEVWRNLSKLFYRLGSYSFLGIVAAGFVSKEVEETTVILGGVFALLFALGGFALEYLTYEKRR